MRIVLLLLAAFIGSILGGATVDLFIHGQTKGIPLEMILVGAFPVALLTSSLAWTLSARKALHKKGRK